MQVADGHSNGGGDPQDARTALVNVLKKWNAADAEETVGELLARVTAEDQAEAERARSAALQRQISELNSKLDQVISSTAPKPEPERRSRMSAARKSQLIRQLGLAGYQALPW
jgi:hypothetical protein